MKKDKCLTAVHLHYLLPDGHYSQLPTTDFKQISFSHDTEKQSLIHKWHAKTQNSYGICAPVRMYPIYEARGI